MGHGYIINRLSSSIICFYAFYTFSFAFASIGDQSPQFRECISACTKIHNCPPKHGYFGWWAREECFSCRQKCIWATVDHFANRGRPIPQFNGKWPFVPFRIHLGNIFVPIQEPASMLFSLLNAFTVWRMLKRIRREIRPDWYCLRIWVQFGRVGMATWFASVIFHCCDHWVTEMADYCAAFGLILFTLYASLCFVLPQWNLPTIGQFGHFNHQNLRLIGFGLLFFYFRYLHSMYTASYFDYGFHIRCCVQIALFTGALFLCWTIFEYKARRARHSMLFLGAAFGIGWFSALFDALFDFPPFLWLIDAHSLFHLFSIPVPLLWAEFLCQEARLDTKRE